jgi:hypothetical protein
MSILAERPELTTESARIPGEECGLLQKEPPRFLAALLLAGNHGSLPACRVAQAGSPASTSQRRRRCAKWVRAAVAKR